jgi:hypothetical protein
MALRANFQTDHGKSTCSRLLYFYHSGNNGCMNRDQPLIHLYHKNFLPTRYSGARTPPFVNEASLTHGGRVADVSGVKIRFHRCVASGQIPRGSHA